ncbi:MAG: type VI secretion protein ImpB [Pseudomonadota bacterium]
MRQPTDIESLYLDFDGFFANAEKTLRPEFADRPVGVIPLHSEHTSLIARCYKAKAYGIKRGTRAKDAKDLCPNIALLVARHDDYVKLHHRILKVIDRFVPVKKVWSIDEMECELIGSERQRGEQIARDIKAALREEFGPHLTCSIGLAPNQFLAKVAAEMNKPDGLVVMPPEKLPGQLFDLALTDLPGISENMERRLRRANVNTVEELWSLSPKHARKIWNNVEGERMWAALRGYAVSRPETVRRMFGHGRILSADWRTPEKARDCLRLLTVKAARRLRREHYTAQCLSISLGLPDKRRWGRETQFFPARDDRTFLIEMDRLFQLGRAATGAKTFRKVSVMLHGIAPEGQTSDDLFEQIEHRSKRAKWETLTDVMDQLNARNGGCVVSLGITKDPPGGYAGAKIAFGRVPDLNDFALTPDAARGHAAMLESNQAEANPEIV